MTLFPSYWEIFHWIMWPFYTNFSHKTNNRKGNIILSFKTLGIKLCLGRSSFVIIKRFKELSNDNVRIVRVPWLQGWKFESADFIKNLVWERFVTSKANSLSQCLAAFWYLPWKNKTVFTVEDHLSWALIGQTLLCPRLIGQDRIITLSRGKLVFN